MVLDLSETVNVRYTPLEEPACKFVATYATIMSSAEGIDAKQRRLLSRPRSVHFVKVAVAGNQSISPG